MSDRSLRLEVLLQAIDRATGPIKAVAGNSRGMARAVQDARNRMRELEDQNKRIDHFRKVAQDVSVTANAMDAAQARVRDLAREMRATDSPSKAMVRNFEAAKREAGQLKDRHQNLTQQQQRLRTELTAVGVPLKGMAEHQAQLRRRIDEARQSMERQQAALKRFADADVAGAFSRMSGEVGRLARRSAMLGGAAAGGIFALSNSTATLGDDVAKTADKMGLQLAVLQELRYAGERSGVETEHLDKGMLDFTRRLGEATRGTGAAVKAYDELGLSAAALSAMSPEQALGAVADRLAQIEDHNQRLSYAGQIFNNKGGAAMLNMLRGGSAGLEELRRQARLTGYVLSDDAARGAEDYKDALLDAQLTMAGLKNTIGAELMPAVTDMMRAWSGWLQENRAQVQAWAQAFGDRLKAAVPAILEAGRGVASLTQRIADGIGVVARMVGGFENLGMIIAVLFASKAIMSVIMFGAAIFKAGAAIGSLAMALPAVSGAVSALFAAIKANPFVLVAAFVTGFVSHFIKNWDSLTAFWKAGDWASIGRFIIEGLESGLNFATAGLYNVFKNVVSGAIDLVKSLFGIRSPSTVFAEIGAHLMQGLANGIRNALGSVRDSITGAGDAAIGWFKEKLGIRSPSRVFAALGDDTMAGLAMGLERSERSPLAALSRAARNLTAAAGIGLAGMAAADGGFAIDNRPPLAAGGSAGINAGASIYNITIHASPGMNEQTLAHLVAAELDRRDRDRAARHRSRLSDID